MRGVRGRSNGVAYPAKSRRFTAFHKPPIFWKEPDRLDRRSLSEKQIVVMSFDDAMRSTIMRFKGERMGGRGAVILSFFGSVFVALTMYWQWHVTGIALALPFIVFAILGSLAIYAIRLPGGGDALSEKTQRVIIWSSMAEGLGIFIGINVVINLHRPEWQLPVMALVVGLHFLPIAFSASSRRLYALAAAMITSAAVGFVVAAPAGGEIAGIAAAATLWIAACLGVASDLRSKQIVRPAFQRQ